MFSSIAAFNFHIFDSVTIPRLHDYPLIFKAVTVFNSYFFAPFFLSISLLSLKLFKIRISIKLILLAQLIYFLSFLFAHYLIQLIPRPEFAILTRNSRDSIDIIKTGYVIPFIFISIGFPFIYSSMQNDRTKKFDFDEVLDSDFSN